MVTKMNIINDKNKTIRKVSEEVTFPLSVEDKKLINDIIKYLTNSQIEKIAKKYNMRPGMGLSAVQIGILKRFFVVVHEQEEKETFKNYVLINPKIVSSSEEMIYVEEGEGCLSVERDVEGIVPRAARITIEGYDIEGKKIKIRAREDLAIAFQHEMDHLNGILFYDHIDSKNPYKNGDIYRAI